MRFALFLLALGLASPEDPEAMAHARKTYELSRQGKTAEAEQEIRESIRLAPENPLYHSALAGLVQKAGNLEEAKAEFEKALDSRTRRVPERVSARPSIVSRALNRWSGIPTCRTLPPWVFTLWVGPGWKCI
jgi:tetratricopeptide (TPR) repeat protein